MCTCVLSHVRLFMTPVDCSPPGSSVHGISQARILEWVTISSSRGSSWLRDQTSVSCSQVLYQLSHKGSSKTRKVIIFFKMPTFCCLVGPPFQNQFIYVSRFCIPCTKLNLLCFMELLLSRFLSFPRTRWFSGDIPFLMVTKTTNNGYGS